MCANETLGKLAALLGENLRLSFKSQSGNAFQVSDNNNNKKYLNKPIAKIFSIKWN